MFYAGHLSLLLFLSYDFLGIWLEWGKAKNEYRSLVWDVILPPPWRFS
jgi:hypothetical protein